MSADPALEPSQPTADPVTPQPAIELRSLRRDYADLPVLLGVSLDLARGETLAVIGANGAGKTTLLRVLGTLLRPTSGEIRVLGAALPGDAWRVRGRIGFLGHEPLLYRELTVRENLRFNARLHGLDAAEEAIAGVLRAAALTRYADEQVRSLSAGTLQRASICRAVLHDPELLLLDEPLSHLDPDATAHASRLIGARPGRTRVIVSHDVDRALAEADRTLALRADGTVGYCGPAAGLSPGDARAIYAGRDR
ncbi:MAG TPA: ABC transporter ATP-binding protein [Solirubrobacterales bacterium]|nr:ABC transporter ATP-binding protein [Solirubrobacterales bacterium]